MAIPFMLFGKIMVFVVTTVINTQTHTHVDKLQSLSVLEQVVHTVTIGPWLRKERVKM